MKKAFAITILAAAATDAGAQILVIPPAEKRIALDDTSDFLFIPDPIIGPLPDSIPADKPTLEWSMPVTKDNPENDISDVFESGDRQFPAEQTHMLVATDSSTDEDNESYIDVSTEVDFAFSWAVNISERDWKYIVIHHSATSGGSVESIHREHSRRRDASGRPWLGIGYHFVVGNGSGMDDGETEATFRWNEQLHGAHSGSVRHNGTGIGICVIGNFEKKQPSRAQTEAIVRLVSQLAREYNISADHIIGHRNIRATLCPGRHFPLEQIVKDSVGQDSPRRSRKNE